MIKLFSLRLMSFLMLATASLTVSCGGDQDTAETVPLENEGYLEDYAGNRVTYVLPSPYQIAEMFRRAGLTYEPGLSQPVEQVTTYNSSFQKNIAFGIYSADLAYALVNNQLQEAMIYLKVIRQLANDLGYGQAFDSESFFTRFENNLGNEDSVAFLLGDLQLAMTDLLNENNEDYISPVIFSSAWVESMYLGVKSYERIKNEDLLNRLQEQHLLLENVLNALNQHKNKFKGIPSLINRLELIKEKLAAAENNGEEGFPQLSQAVIAARNALASGRV